MAAVSHAEAGAIAGARAALNSRGHARDAPGDYGRGSRLRWARTIRRMRARPPLTRPSRRPHGWEPGRRGATPGRWDWTGDPHLTRTRRGKKRGATTGRGSRHRGARRRGRQSPWVVAKDVPREFGPVTSRLRSARRNRGAIAVATGHCGLQLTRTRRADGRRATITAVKRRWHQSAMGAGLRPGLKALESPPEPSVCAPAFPPDEVLRIGGRTMRLSVPPLRRRGGADSTTRGHVGLRGAMTWRERDADTWLIAHRSRTEAGVGGLGIATGRCGASASVLVGGGLQGTRTPRSETGGATRGRGWRRSG